MRLRHNAVREKRFVMSYGGDVGALNTRAGRPNPTDADR